MSIEGTLQLQHLNFVFDLQDSLCHTKSEDSITMVEREEHPNTKEPMNTQELLNTMVASQIQLREDMNLIIQQFQNLNGSQEENMTNQNSSTLEGEKKINERISKMK